MSPTEASLHDWYIDKKDPTGVSLKKENRPLDNPLKLKTETEMTMHTFIFCLIKIMKNGVYNNLCKKKLC